MPAPARDLAWCGRSSYPFMGPAAEVSVTVEVMGTSLVAERGRRMGRRALFLRLGDLTLPAGPALRGFESRHSLRAARPAARTSATV